MSAEEWDTSPSAYGGHGGSSRPTARSRASAAADGAEFPTGLDTSGGAAAVALQVGWTMSTLYDPPAPGLRPARDLATVDELSGAERIDLELARLAGLLVKLSALVETSVRPLPADISSLRRSWGPPAGGRAGSDALDVRHAALRESLDGFHLGVMEALAAAGDGLDGVYELGLWLRCTAHPLALAAYGMAVSPVEVLRTALSRRRVTTIQRYLRMFAPEFPPDAAAVVSESVGKWSDFFTTVIEESTPGRLKQPARAQDVASDMLAYLAPQGDMWLHILTGSQTTDGLLSPEGTVGAAEAALRRARRLVGKVVWHYLPGLAVLLAALGGIVYLAQTDLAGAGRVWTEIAAIAGTLGVSARGIGSTVARLAREGATPLMRLEEVDAKAWAITTLPGVQLNARGVAELRRSGIAPASRLGRS